MFKFDISEWIIFIILCFLLYKYLSSQQQEVVLVKSRVDGNEYLVLNLPDKQEAADLLGKLNLEILKIIGLLERDFPDKEEVKFVKQNYKDGALTEASENGGSSTSYTINKKEIFVCLRNENGGFVDWNTLIYVCLIHEGGHMACNEIGHTPYFWEVLNFMKQQAIRYKIYKPTDYNKNPTPYCGIVLNSGG